jgi:hypothetical protein
MTLSRSRIFSLVGITGFLFLFACTTNDKTATEQTGSSVSIDAKKPAGQFPFYKNISVRPGLNFEVVSWGKGVDSVGGYLILMSDSIKNNYKSLSNERKGIITDVWNMDMDNDGNPELYIELLSKKNVLDLNVYEYNSNGFQKINFPSLSNALKRNYQGNDRFTIKEGELYRAFPIVNPADTSVKAGSLKTLKYSLRGNSFSVDEVKEDEVK